MQAPSENLLMRCGYYEVIELVVRCRIKLELEQEQCGFVQDTESGNVIFIRIISKWAVWKQKDL